MFRSFFYYNISYQLRSADKTMKKKLASLSAVCCLFTVLLSSGNIFAKPESSDKKAPWIVNTKLNNFYKGILLASTGVRYPSVP